LAVIFTIVCTPLKFYSDPVLQQAVSGGQFNVVSLFTKHDKWSNLTLYPHGQKLLCIVLPFFFCLMTKYHLSIICKFMGFVP